MYTFAPRYAQFGRVIDEMFTIQENRNGSVTLSLKKPIKTGPVIEQWDTIQRIVISLQENVSRGL